MASLMETIRTISSLGQIEKTNYQAAAKMKNVQRGRAELYRDKVSKRDFPEYQTPITDVSSVSSTTTKATSKASSISNYTNNSLIKSDGDNSDAPPKECQCSPDLYTRVLGPTADEIILSGLQTVMNLCSRIKTCPEAEEEEEEEEQDEEEIQQETLEDNAAPEMPEKDNLPDAEIQTETARVSSSGFQANPHTQNEISQAGVQFESKIQQTTPVLATELTQTSQEINSVSTLVQTSNPNLHSEKVQTLLPEVYSGGVQTYPEIRMVTQVTTPLITEQSNISTFTDVQELKETGTGSETKTNNDDNSDDKGKQEKGSQQQRKGDEHSCICPPDPPSTTTRSKCQCCTCSSATVRKSCRKNCMCQQKKVAKCKCSSTTLAKGDNKNPLEVRYAVTKITKYPEFTTYEVMKSTRSQPSKIPKSIEGVFVLRKNKKS